MKISHISKNIENVKIYDKIDFSGSIKSELLFFSMKNNEFSFYPELHIGLEIMNFYDEILVCKLFNIYKFS